MRIFLEFEPLIRKYSKVLINFMTKSPKELKFIYSYFFPPKFQLTKKKHRVQ